MIRKSHLRSLLLCSSMLLAVAWSRPGLAQTVAPVLPPDGAFVRGAGQISQPSASQLTVTQSTRNGVIDWRGFSIGADGQVAINNGSGATLNRVNGGDISRIDGLLTATGGHRAGLSQQGPLRTIEHTLRA